MALYIRKWPAPQTTEKYLDVDDKTAETAIVGFGSSPEVVLDENSLEVLSKISFERIYKLAILDNVDQPPEVDDLTARTINRMGGWVFICEQWSKKTKDEIEGRFFSIFSEFILFKVNGHYESDRLPRLLAKTRVAKVHRMDSQILARSLVCRQGIGMQGVTSEK